MREYIKKDDVLNLLNRNSITKKITFADGISIYDSVKNLSTADVVPKAEVEKYKSVVERDIVIVGRRQGKEAESREILRYRADLIREAAVREFVEKLCAGRVGNDPVSIAARCELRAYIEENAKECPTCKYFVGCEKANYVRGCEEYREKEGGTYD